MLGKFLPTIDRSKFVIATKVARYEKNPKKMFDFSHDRALRSVDESLARLGLDFVDIIQVLIQKFPSSLYLYPEKKSLEFYFESISQFMTSNSHQISI